MGYDDGSVTVTNALALAQFTKDVDWRLFGDGPTLRSAVEDASIHHAWDVNRRAHVHRTVHLALSHPLVDTHRGTTAR